MLEIEKYITKHVGRKVLITLTFSPSPTGGLAWSLAVSMFYAMSASGHSSPASSAHSQPRHSSAPYLFCTQDKVKAITCGTTFVL